MAMINSLDAITMLPRTAEAADIQGRENQLMEHAALQTGQSVPGKSETKSETGGRDAEL